MPHLFAYPPPPHTQTREQHNPEFYDDGQYGRGGYVGVKGVVGTAPPKKTY